MNRLNLPIAILFLAASFQTLAANTLIVSDSSAVETNRP